MAQSDKQIFELDIQKQSLTLDGVTYSHEEILSFLKDKSEYCGLYTFLFQWFDGDTHIKVHTSGSTGKPKELVVRKEQMMQSARLTCEFLNLRKGDTALICMSMDYIAGKMMAVRALIAGLDLHFMASCGHPFEKLDKPFRFVAMVPLQVFNSLQIPEERERLKQTEILIIGGGTIDPLLEEELKDFPSEIYCTYGMTETLSHIALRRISGQEASLSYRPFSSVNLSLSPEDTLVIDAPLVSDERLVTNDIAEIHADGSFDILGRKDNTINSGGVKIQIEQVEAKLKPLLNTPFAVTSQSHPKFGEIVVLLVVPPVNTEILKDEMAKLLSPYQMPKKIILVDAIPQTESGKISRAKVKEMASGL
ncbi:AMP-binding protein [uncultured Bacteroides sp.]|uniref:AMP-binding protein n=1 Tax=uncultured Bacteroides sp. TaxID=162156 RepID=UPI002AAAAFC2|nr:AMP-binding protein [uncultured Bacteroides sp.]